MKSLKQAYFFLRKTLLEDYKVYNNKEGEGL